MGALVSIIIPVYNVKAYLDQCLDSVVKQTYSNIEIVLVDDGSKDSSGEKCERWKKMDDRIMVLHKENGGMSDARNVGLNYCSGEYASFVDFLEEGQKRGMELKEPGILHFTHRCCLFAEYMIYKVIFCIMKFRLI